MKNLLIDKNRGKMRMRMRMYVGKFLAVREDLKNFQRCSNIATFNAFFLRFFCCKLLFRVAKMF